MTQVRALIPAYCRLGPQIHGAGGALIRGSGLSLHSRAGPRARGCTRSTRAAPPSATTTSSRAPLVPLVVERVAELALRRLSALSLLRPRALIAPLIPLIPLAGRRLQRRDRARTVLDDAFERARAALVEIQPTRDRLEPHLQALQLNARARELDDEVVNHFVVERVEPRVVLRVAAVHLRLDVQRLDQRIRIEQQLEERAQQRAQPADRRAVRLVERVFAEVEIRRRRFRVEEPLVFLEQA